MANIHTSAQTLGVPIPARPLDAAMTSLSNTIGQLDSTATELISRLHRVLMPTPACPAPTGTKLQEVSCQTSPAVEDVEIQRGRLENIERCLQDVLNRLEA